MMFKDTELATLPIQSSETPTASVSLGMTSSAPVRAQLVLKSCFPASVRRVFQDFRALVTYKRRPSYIPSRTLPWKACRWLGRHVPCFTFLFLNPAGEIPSPGIPKPPGHRLAAGLTGDIAHQPRRPKTTMDAVKIRHQAEGVNRPTRVRIRALLIRSVQLSAEPLPHGHVCATYSSGG